MASSKWYGVVEDTPAARRDWAAGVISAEVMQLRLQHPHMENRYEKESDARAQLEAECKRLGRPRVLVSLDIAYEVADVCHTVVETVVKVEDGSPPK